MDEQDGTIDDELTGVEVRNWLEFGCWTTLALTPLLYYVNGPAVSIDQLVVRSCLVAIALAGAVGLRARRKRSGVRE